LIFQTIICFFYSFFINDLIAGPAVLKYKFTYKRIYMYLNNI